MVRQCEAKTIQVQVGQHQANPGCSRSSDSIVWDLRCIARCRFLIAMASNPVAMASNLTAAWFHFLLYLKISPYCTGQYLSFTFGAGFPKLLRLDSPPNSIRCVSLCDKTGSPENCNSLGTSGFSTWWSPGFEENGSVPPSSLP